MSTWGARQIAAGEKGRTDARRTSFLDRATTLARAAIALCCALVVAGPAQLASAEPSDTTDPSTAAGTLPVATQLTAVIDSQAATTTITLPAGTNATRLQGTLHVDQALAGATVAVTVDSAVIATVDVSSAGEYPLDAEVTDGAGPDLELGLSYSSDHTVSGATTDVCVSQEWGQTATLSAITVVLGGDAQLPQTVAEFVQGPASQYVIVAQDPADAGQQAAALAAVAALSARTYAPTTVTVADEIPTEGAYPGAVRALRLVTGTEASQTIDVADGVPVLTITGQAPDQLAAARSLADDRLALAAAPQTTNLTGGVDAAALGTSVTLEDLGVGAARLRGLGRSQVYVWVPQARFGGPVNSFEVHLVGAVTAIEDAASATATVYWNDDLVDSFTLGSVGDGGQVDRTIEIPASRVTASNSLVVELSAVGPGGICPPSYGVIPIGWDLDVAASTITGERGQSLPAGFGRFPQVFAGTVPIVLDSALDAAAALQSAADLVASLARAAGGAPLTTELVSVEAAVANSGPVLVVGASEQTAADLRAVLRPAEFRTVTDSQVPFGVGVDRGFAALEAFTSGGRDVLMLTAWSPSGDATERDELATSLSSQIAAAEYGWQSWADDLVVLGGPEEKATNLSSGALVPQEQVTEEYRPVVWWAVAAGALLVVLVVFGAAWRRRQRRRRETHALVAAQHSANRPEASDDHSTRPDRDES